MTEPHELMKWINRGSQRRSVARNVWGIKTGTQIWHAGRAEAPRLTLRDTRAILRQLEARGLVECLNPNASCGRLFRPTPKGEDLLRHGFQIQQSAAAELLVPAETLSFVLRGKVRHAVFRTLVEPPYERPAPTAASQIKRYLRGSCPVTLNQTIRSLKELESVGLIQPTGSRTRLNAYAVTEKGSGVAKCLETICGQNSTSEPSEPGQNKDSD